MGKALLFFDTDQIHRYVFAVGHLKLIRGASSILDRLNRIKVPSVVVDAAPGAETVFAGGGSAMFVVDDDKARDALVAVQRLYLQETETAFITGATLSLPEGGLWEADTRKERDLLSHRLRAAKMRGRPPVAMPTSPFFKFCEVCGTLYAWECEGAEAEKLLCGSCYRKWEEDRRIKEQLKDWLKTSEAVADSSDGEMWFKLITELRKQGYPFTAPGGAVRERPEDFDALGRQSQPENYMGLIYADGDATGDEIARLKSLQAVRNFSLGMDAALYQAVCRGIITHLQPRTEDDSLPFDVLLLGGDDLVMVTRAQSAMEVAIDLARDFSLLTDELIGHRLRLSVSVVIGPAKMPFKSLIHLASAGLRLAKREAAVRCQKGENLSAGMVNFAVVRGGGVAGEEYFDALVQERHDGQSWRLTLRPGGIEEMERLVDAVRQLKDLPRVKLHQLRHACYLDWNNGTLAALRAWIKLSQKHRSVIGQALQPLLGCAIVPLPWFYRQGEVCTPWIDITDLMDFLE